MARSFAILFSQLMAAPEADRRRIAGLIGTELDALATQVSQNAKKATTEAAVAGSGAIANTSSYDNGKAFVFRGGRAVGGASDSYVTLGPNGLQFVINGRLVAIVTVTGDLLCRGGFSLANGGIFVKKLPVSNDGGYPVGWSEKVDGGRIIIYKKVIHGDEHLGEYEVLMTVNANGDITMYGDPIMGVYVGMGLAYPVGGEVYQDGIYDHGIIEFIAGGMTVMKITGTDMELAGSISTNVPNYLLSGGAKA